MGIIIIIIIKPRNSNSDSDSKWKGFFGGEAEDRKMGDRKVKAEAKPPVNMTVLRRAGE